MLAILAKSAVDGDWLSLAGLIAVIGLLGMRELTREQARRGSG